MKLGYVLSCATLAFVALFQGNSALLAQDVAAAARANRANHDNAASANVGSEDSGGVSVSLPGEPWMVRIDAPDFVVDQDEMRGQGQKYLMATNNLSKVVLSVTLEKVNGPAEIGGCRSYLQRLTAAGGPFKFTDVKAREINSVPVIEYLVPEAAGINVEQGNLFACMVKADVYIDIHLSKIQFQTKDEALFEAVLTNTHILPVSANASLMSSGSVRKLFSDGSRAYLKRDFAAAIPPYEQVFDLEKRRRTLDQTMTRVLIDNLGMAYGITGNLGKASEVFTYGISIDPNYPLFYYNMACVYGEKNDLENAIAYLQKAFANRANMIPGEQMPDPRTDDSFTRFMKNDRFVREVTSLVPSAQ